MTESFYNVTETFELPDYLRPNDAPTGDPEVDAALVEMRREIVAKWARVAILGQDDEV